MLFLLFLDMFLFAFCFAHISFHLWSFLLVSWFLFAFLHRFLNFLLGRSWEYSHFNANDSLLKRNRCQRFQPFKIVILANCINFLEKFQNVPNTNFSIGISRKQIIPLLNSNSFEVFDPGLVSLEVYTLLIVLVRPNFDLSFFGLIRTKILPTRR